MQESSLSAYLNVTKAAEPDPQQLQHNFRVAVIRRAREIIFQNRLIEYSKERLAQGVSEEELAEELNLILSSRA